ncbi:MAG TPA: alpha-amylase family protein, partial [Phycisphaerae bacterium]
MEDPFILNRREFLAATAMVAASALQARAQTVPAPLPATVPVPTSEIFDKPMRWAQLVLADTDPGTYDLAFWLDYFKRIHADGACLSAGGCVAYYPTQIPFHYKSASMKTGTDPFGDLVNGCRKMNMAVIARTDPHSIRDDAAAAHPEWVACDVSGAKRKHWAAPNRWVTCCFGDYNFQFMNDVHKEIVTRYPVDAIFVNRWQGSGTCYCDSCKRQFRDFCGMEIPRGTAANDPQNVATRNYLQWSGKRLFELWRTWDSAIREINPKACFVANSGGGSTSTLDMKTIGDLAPIMAADRQSRRGIMAPWASGKNGKEFRATLGNKPVLGIAALGIDDDHRWKDSVLNEPELRIWIADGLANGLRPWIAKFGGIVYDKRWMPAIEKIYTWQFQNEKYLRNTQNLARVAMVYSQQTGTYYGGANKRSKVEDHELGLYHALVEARIPFEMVHDKLLDAPNIDRYKLLLLPNTAALSDAQCDQLRQYVRRGG